MTTGHSPKSVILENDILLVFQNRRFCLDTKSKSYNDKTVMLNVACFVIMYNDKTVIFRMIMYMTHTVKAVVVRLKNGQLLLAWIMPMTDSVMSTPMLFS